MPNSMNFTPPAVGTVGPDWAEDINTILNTNIAEHTHTAGSGVPLTQDSIVIDASFPLNNQALTNTKAVQLTAQASAPALAGSLYNSGGNLYFRNGSSQNVQITNGSAVSPLSSGGINGLTSASGGGANYIAGTFSWTKNSNTGYAAMVSGDVKIYNSSEVSPTAGITLKTPTGLASSFDLTLPEVAMTLPTAYPAAYSYLGMDTSGNVVGKVLNYGSVDITETAFTTPFNATTNLIGTVTLSNITGRKIEISIQSKDSNLTTAGDGAGISLASTTTATDPIIFYLRLTVNGSTSVGAQQVYKTYDPSAGVNAVIMQPAFTYVYQPTSPQVSAGSVTFRLYGTKFDADHSIVLFNSKLVVREL